MKSADWIAGLECRLRAVAISLIAALFLALAVSPAQAYVHKVTLGESYIVFDPGDDWCRLDPTRGELEASFVYFDEKVNRGLYDTLAIFAPCDELEELRSWRILCLTRWTALYTAVSDGRPEAAPAAARPASLERLEEDLADNFTVSKTEINRRISLAIPDYIEEQIGAVEISGMRYLGVLGRDTAAVYAGVTVETSVAGIKASTATVTALSTVNGVVVAYTAYRPHVDTESYVQLMEVVQPAMQSLPLNDPPEEDEEAGLRNAALMTPAPEPEFALDLEFPLRIGPVVIGGWLYAPLFLFGGFVVWVIWRRIKGIGT